MSTATIAALATAIPAVLGALTALVVALRTKSTVGPKATAAGSAAGAAAVTEHLSTQGSPARALIASVARSVAKDAVQEVSEAQAKPFIAGAAVPGYVAPAAPPEGHP